MKNKLFFKYILILCLCLPIQAWSFPYSDIYVFGDSLSDTGRLFEVTGIPPTPYYDGRFSNGEVWVEILAKNFLDLEYNPANNFAWGGATTGETNVWGEDLGLELPGLQQQVDTYLADTNYVADPNGLYVVWAGSNDFLGGFSSEEDIAIAVAIAVTNIITAVTKLHLYGAKNILVPTMPNLGITPIVRALGPEAMAIMTGLTVAFNQTLTQELANNPDLQSVVIQVDIPTSLEMIISDETIAPVKITNVTDACFNIDTDPPTICEESSEYLFWDDVHPTTAVHQAIALVFYSAVAEPVYKFTTFNASLDIPLIDNFGNFGNVIGTTMSRVLDYTRFDLVIEELDLQTTATELQSLISFPCGHQSPRFNPSSGILHLPIVHVAKNSSQGLKFIAKYRMKLRLVPETNPPRFVLKNAVPLPNHRITPRRCRVGTQKIRPVVMN